MYQKQEKEKKNWIEKQPRSLDEETTGVIHLQLYGQWNSENLISILLFIKDDSTREIFGFFPVVVAWFVSAVCFHCCDKLCSWAINPHYAFCTFKTKQTHYYLYLDTMIWCWGWFEYFAALARRVEKSKNIQISFQSKSNTGISAVTTGESLIAPQGLWTVDS